MKRLALVATILIAAVSATVNAAPDEPEIFSNRAGAIRGYDPVAYFTEGEPVKGDREITYRWKEADWYFASKANLDLFRNDPEKYAPQYGGWCAYAMSRGYYASIDPDAWTIHEGKLYLNYSLRVRRKWAKAIPENIVKADRNWQELRSL